MEMKYDLLELFIQEKYINEMKKHALRNNNKCDILDL